MRFNPLLWGSCLSFICGALLFSEPHWKSEFNRETQQSVDFNTNVKKKLGLMGQSAKVLIENPSFLSFIRLMQRSSIRKNLDLLTRDQIADTAVVYFNEDKNCEKLITSGNSSNFNLCENLSSGDTQPFFLSQNGQAFLQVKSDIIKPDEPSHSGFQIALFANLDAKSFVPDTQGTNISATWTLKEGKNSTFLDTPIFLGTDGKANFGIFKTSIKSKLMMSYPIVFGFNSHLKPLYLCLLILGFLVIIGKLLLSIRSLQICSSDLKKVTSYIQGGGSGNFMDPHNRVLPEFDQKETGLALKAFLDSGYLAHQRLKDEIIGLEGKIRKLKKELTDTQISLAEHFEGQELSEQIKLASSELLSRLGDTIDTNQDLCDMLQLGIAQAVGGLSEFNEHWQEGIRQRGARKFIRSLAETKSADSDSSLLESELLRLEILSKKAQEFAISALSSQQKIKKQLDWFLKITSYWHSLSVNGMESPGLIENSSINEQSHETNLQQLVELSKDLIPGSQVIIDQSFGNLSLPHNISRKGFIATLSGAIRILSYDQQSVISSNRTVWLSTRDSKDKLNILLLGQAEILTHNHYSTLISKLTKVAHSYGIHLEKLHTPTKENVLLSISWSKATQRNIECLKPEKSESIDVRNLSTVSREKTMEI